jgi:hypothetical protein
MPWSSEEGKRSTECRKISMRPSLADRAHEGRDAQQRVGWA